MRKRGAKKCRFTEIASMQKVLLEGCHAQVFSYMNLSNVERLYVKIFAGTGYKFYIENSK